MLGRDEMHTGYPGSHHTSLTNGRAVSAAGVMVVRDGRVLAIDNRSGHYRPGSAELANAVRYLHAGDAFAAGAVVALYVDESSALHLSPDGFLRAAAEGLAFPAVAREAALQQQANSGEWNVPDVIEALLPPTLKRPVTIAGRNRLDTVLMGMYKAPDAGLTELIARFLRWADGVTAPQTAPEAGGWTRAAPASDDTERARMLRDVTLVATQLRLPGTLCRMPEMVSALARLSQTWPASARAKHGAELIAIDQAVRQLKPTVGGM